MNDNNARYVISELLTALHSIIYREGGNWRSGVHGDSYVTDIVGDAVATAEAYLRQAEQKETGE